MIKAAFIAALAFALGVCLYDHAIDIERTAINMQPRCESAGQEDF